MIYSVPNVGQHGIIADVQAHELPFNAWSGGQNVRARDGYMEKFYGHEEVFASPTIAPYFAVAVPTPSSYFWVYAGLTKAYVWDGSSHTNITRQTASVDVDYNATIDRNWTATILGGIPVLNNGVDTPQMWLPQQTSTKLAEISNWPANTLCSSIRAFKQFLVALDVTKTSTRYAHMVKWSHPADPGAVPSTWDETDVTKDAGETELKESGGFLVDSRPMRDINVLYKEDEIWGMQFIGGIEIFRFYNIFRSIGAVSRRCAQEVFSGMHVVFGFDDIVAHDGQQARSILNRKLRRYLYNNIDSSYISRCFVTLNPRLKEAWFCYPETGQTLPNKALVWQLETNAIGIRDLNLFPHIAIGQINPGVSSDQWSAAVGSWDSDSQTWGERLYTPQATRQLICDPANSKLFLGDSTNTYDGTAMTSYLERTGLGFPMKQDAPPDFEKHKFLRRIFPRIEGTDGGVVQVYVGYQNKIDGPVTYGSPQPFTIGTSEFVDFRVNARLHAIKFESTTDVEWRLHGYEVDVVLAGKH